MGKLYKANLDEIAIIDGKLVNVSVTDNFSSQNDTTKESRTLENVTFTLDGLAMEEVVRLLWSQLKVVAQARTFKNLSDEDFTALDNDTHEIMTYIPKSERTSNKVAIINTLKIATQKKFFDKALEKALDELGTDATTEEHVGWATKYYDEEYKDIVESMI